MLTRDELDKLFDKLGTPEKGRFLVEKARREAPVRQVQSNGGNVVTIYQSRKMGRPIATESSDAEYPALIDYEHNKEVIAYYAQPFQIDFFRTDGGKKFRVAHTPDFLIIRSDQLVVEEWKIEGKLLKLSAKYPQQYVREVDGWHDPELEEYFKELGITYRLRSASEHPRLYVQNLKFLSDYYDPSYPEIEADKLQALKEVLNDKAYLPIKELVSLTNGLIKEELADHIDLYAQKAVSYDDVYKAIADGEIAFDHYRTDISWTDVALVYRDSDTMLFDQKIESMGGKDPVTNSISSIQIGASIDYDGHTYQVLLVGTHTVTLKGDDGSIELNLDVVEGLFHEGKINIRNIQSADSGLEAIRTASPKRLNRSLQREQILELAAADPTQSERSTRTLQRYRERQKNAGEGSIDKLLSLSPEEDGRGKQRKISEEHLEDIEELIKDKYNDPANITKTALYKQYLKLCTENNYTPCSQKTFNREIDKHSSVRSRKGRRFHYQQKQINWHLHHKEAIHGVRPFEIVHIDHTLADLEIRGVTRAILLGKAWLSVGSDAASRSVLGQYLTFDPPSYRSVMMVLRDIVRKHGRMPGMLVVDNGPDFRGHELKRLCRLYGTSLRYRPKGEPRHGSVIERLFGVTNTQFLHTLNGNTQLMKHARMVTKSINPKNFAEWTLPALHAGLEYYYDVLHGGEIHPAHGETPNENFERRLIETGERRNRLVRFDRQFLIETCPSPKDRAERRVDWQRGIKVNHIWYSAEDFRTEFMGGKDVQVRIDPWNASVIYALVKDKWVTCRSKLFPYREYFTQVELQYGLDELARKFQVKKKELTPERVSEWLRILNPANFDPRLLEEQSEARLIYERLGMASVDTNAPPLEPAPTASQPRGIKESAPADDGNNKYEKVVDPETDEDEKENEYEFI